MANAQGISVIVCTYNRCQSLQQCLDSLLLLDYPEYEIVVVDDCSIDETKFFLQSLRDSRIKVVHQACNSGLSQARNVGVLAARYEVVAFTDDDCVVDNDWLKYLSEKIFQGGAGLVSGQTFYKSCDYKGYFPERVVQNIDARWPMGCNLAYRKAIFSSVGGFSHYFYKFNNEDTEMAIRAIAGGFTWLRAPQAVMYHQQANWTTDKLYKSARNFAVWPALKKLYPKHFRLLKPRLLWGVVVEPVDYLLILFFPIILPVLLARYFLHDKRDFKIFFAKWPAYFILRRYYIYKEAVKNRVLMF